MDNSNVPPGVLLPILSLLGSVQRSERDHHYRPPGTPGKVKRRAKRKAQKSARRKQRGKR